MIFVAVLDIQPGRESSAKRLRMCEGGRDQSLTTNNSPCLNQSSPFFDVDGTSTVYSTIEGREFALIMSSADFAYRTHFEAYVPIPSNLRISYRQLASLIARLCKEIVVLLLS